MLGRGHAQSAPDTDLASRQELQDEINELRTLLRDASGRLLDLQRRVNRLRPETETATPREMSAPAASSQVQPEQTCADVERAAVGAAQAPVESAPLRGPVPQPVLESEIERDAPADGGGWYVFSPSLDWERLLGRNWFAIIGAIALVVGIGFFLKLAFDNNWIGDTGRVVLGLALLGVGEYAQRRIPIWAQPSGTWRLSFPRRVASVDGPGATPTMGVQRLGIILHHRRP